MKKLIITSAVVCGISLAASAQTTVKYCDLVCYRPGFKNFVAEMHIDGKTKNRNTVIRDEQGNKMKFASEADALNYVAQQGWELVSSFSRNHVETHFIMSKRG